MRLKTPTFIRLDRRVARAETKCSWCGFASIPLDAVYVPMIGASELSVRRINEVASKSVVPMEPHAYCSARCAAFVVKVPMRVAYLGAA